MKKLLFVFLAFIFFLTACDSDDKNARIEVWLTDAPGDYDAVNIEIIGVEIHADGGEQTKGWKSLDVNNGVYDLLKLTNGLDTLIGSLELPAGRVSQIRLVLGNNNSLVIGDETYDLATPSSQQSGLKIQVHEVLQEGVTYKIVLDFDAARSIVTTGTGGYSLKPVITSMAEPQDGAIKGIVDPAASTPAVYAIQGDDTVRTTYSDDAGRFLLRALPPGSYKVGFSPNSDYKAKAVDGVSVTIGNVTDMGTVVIEEQ